MLIRNSVSAFDQGRLNQSHHLKRRFLQLTTAIAICSITAANADVLTYQFEGSLEEDFGTIAAGTTFTGTFSYDDQQIDSNPSNPDRGDYQIINLTISIAGEQLDLNGPGSMFVYESSSYPTDLTSIYTASPSSMLGGLQLDENSGLLLALQNVDGTAYSTNDVLPGDLSLQDFTQGNATFLQISEAYDNNNPSSRLTVRGELSALNFGTNNNDSPRTYASITYLSDINGNSFPEIAVLSQKGDGQPQIVIKDTFDKSIVNRINFLNSNFQLVDATIVPDMTGNGVDEIAVLGIHKTNGNVRSQIKDALTKEASNDIWFPK